MPNAILTGSTMCASCHCHQTEDRYVDFQAAYDGGAETRLLEDGVTQISTPIDDLIMCETCVKDGAALLGLVENDKALEQIEELKERLARRDERLSELEDALKAGKNFAEKMGKSSLVPA